MRRREAPVAPLHVRDERRPLLLLVELGGLERQLLGAGLELEVVQEFIGWSDSDPKHPTSLCLVWATSIALFDSQCLHEINYTVKAYTS